MLGSGPRGTRLQLVPSSLRDGAAAGRADLNAPETKRSRRRPRRRRNRGGHGVQPPPPRAAWPGAAAAAGPGKRRARLPSASGRDRDRIPPSPSPAGQTLPGRAPTRCPGTPAPRCVLQTPVASAEGGKILINCVKINKKDSDLHATDTAGAAWGRRSARLLWVLVPGCRLIPAMEAKVSSPAQSSGDRRPNPAPSEESPRIPARGGDTGGCRWDRSPMWAAWKRSVAPYAHARVPLGPLHVPEHPAPQPHTSAPPGKTQSQELPGGRAPRSALTHGELSEDLGCLISALMSPHPGE